VVSSVKRILGNKKGAEAPVSYWLAVSLRNYSDNVRTRTRH
jgi:hypothetical protein